MVFEFDYDPAVGRTVEDQPRLSIGAPGLLVQFEAPQVYRDVHYLGPGGAPLLAGTTIDRGHAQWFVLGDNVPISLDSRLVVSALTTATFWDRYDRGFANSDCASSRADRASSLSREWTGFQPVRRCDHVKAGSPSHDTPLLAG